MRIESQWFSTAQYPDNQTQYSLIAEFRGGFFLSRSTVIIISWQAPSEWRIDHSAHGDNLILLHSSSNMFYYFNIAKIFKINCASAVVVFVFFFRFCCFYFSVCRCYLNLNLKFCKIFWYNLPIFPLP